MKNALKLLFGGAVLTLAAGPAIAGKKEDAFAACLWEVAPVSTANWLALPLPSKYQNLGPIQPEYALKQRLDAACMEKLVAQGVKRPRAISIERLRKALAASQPAQLPAQEDDPLAFVCLRFFEDDSDLTSPAAYRWGYGRDFSKSQLGEMSLIFAARGGGGASLADDAGQEKCKFIQSDGTLVDA